MNKEQQQIIDKVYENYKLDTVFKKTRSIGISTTPSGLISKDGFINKCKTDNEFSEKWELKIEERELSFDERWVISKKYGKIKEDCEMPDPNIHYMGLNERETLCSLWDDPMFGPTIPTQLITITHNNKTIESYERNINKK